jgi:hypothetical protein
MYNMDNLIISFTDEFRVLLLYMETTSQVLVLRHSMVSVDPSRGGNYNVITTSRLFFTQLSYILFRVVIISE